MQPLWFQIVPPPVAALPIHSASLAPQKSKALSSDKTEEPNRIIFGFFCPIYSMTSKCLTVNRLQCTHLSWQPILNCEHRSLEILNLPKDHRQFVRLWTSASRRVHAYILSMVLNQADAEDLLQDVGVTVWEKLDEFDSSRDFTAWACGIARNKVLSFNQLASHRLVQSSDLLDRIHAAASSNTRQHEFQHSLLLGCMSRLSEAERQLLRLRYVQENSLKEIAQDTGRSVHALYKSLQRVHLKLFECVSRRLGRGGEI